MKPGDPIPLEFVRSATDVEQLEPTRAELAVVGRSNVGKSSLINALANRKKLARVSNTPGRTQVLNVFSVGDTHTTVVDCPGYGYAATSKAMRADWGRMIEDYLLERPNLERIMVLVDGEIGPTKLDLQMLDWVRAHGLPEAVVATKHDKVKSSKRQKRKRELAEQCDLEPGDVLWVSAHRNVGLERLRGLMRMWLDVA